MSKKILLTEGGNLELAAPLVNAASTYSVTGNACPNCHIEIYSVSGNTASFVGKTRADTGGNFLFESCVPLTGDEIISLAIDTDGNTSVFSESIPITSDDMNIPEKCGENAGS